MGIEYPYLAILAIIAFTIAIMGIVYFFIHTYTEMLKTPVLSTYAEACYVDSNVYLNITLKHERGVPVFLQKIEVYTERGVVVYTPNESLSYIDVLLEGFNGKLNVGQVGFIKMKFPQGYFIVNKTYYGLVFFDIGNTIFTFQLVECRLIITPPQPSIKLVDMGIITRDGTVLGVGVVRIIKNIDIELYSRSNVLYNDTFNSNPFPSRLNNETCSWFYDPVNRSIYARTSVQPDRYGGECVALVNTSLPSNGVVYVASTVKVVMGIGYADNLLVQNSTHFYALGTYFWIGRGNRSYIIRRYAQDWGYLKDLKDETLSYNVSYNLVAVYVYDTGDLALWSNVTKEPKVTANDPSISITPVYAGLGCYYISHPTAPEIFVVFDNVVVTTNAPPWFVNVTGVPDGWRVVLKNFTGGVVSNVTATGGVAILDVWDYFIVPSGTIEIYNEKGVLVASNTFDYVVGGEVYRVLFEEEVFTGLVVGVGGSSKLLVYNISGGVENPLLVDIIDSNSIFNGKTSVSVSASYIYLLNTSGVFKYNLTWELLTGSCRATGVGAGLEVLGNILAIIPGEGNNTLCLYDMSTGESILHPITEGFVTAYTSTDSIGNLLYISLLKDTRPVIVVYNITTISNITVVEQYNITGYKLLGLAFNTINYLYFIHEYGGVYRLNTLTGTTELLPLLLPFTPRGFGDRLVYHSGYLIFARGDNTTELYIIPLTT